MSIYPCPSCGETLSSLTVPGQTGRWVCRSCGWGVTTTSEEVIADLRAKLMSLVEERDELDGHCKRHAHERDEARDEVRVLRQDALKAERRLEILLHKIDLLPPVIYDWLNAQKYGGQDLLHVAVTVDFTGRVRFIRALTNAIRAALNLEST